MPNVLKNQQADLVINLKKLKDNLLTAKSSNDENAVRNCLKRLGSCDITKDAIRDLELGRVLKTFLKDYSEAVETKQAWIKKLGTNKTNVRFSAQDPNSC